MTKPLKMTIRLASLAALVLPLFAPSAQATYEAFAGGKAVFVAGEVFGALSFGVVGG